MANQSDLEKGIEIRKKLSGDRFGTSAGALAELAPDLDEMLNEVVFGRVWTRPGLELKMRSVAVIAALTAMQRLASTQEPYCEWPERRSDQGRDYRDSHSDGFLCRRTHRGECVSGRQRSL